VHRTARPLDGAVPLLLEIPTDRTHEQDMQISS
jgi:hypothetical protein